MKKVLILVLILMFSFVAKSRSAGLHGCSIVKANSCPPYGPRSYHCSPYSSKLYVISCEQIESDRVSKAEAIRILEELKKLLNKQE